MPAGPARPCLPVFALAVILAGSACASVPRVNTAAPLPHYPPGRFTDLLSRELAHVAATPDTRAHVAFGQAFRLVQANGYSVRGNGPYRPLISFGWVNLNAPTDKLSTMIGFQPELADTALTAGDPGRLAARLTGRFDVDQIGTKLRALGARPDHGTWRLRPDHEADNTDPLGRRFPALADQVNLIHAAPHEVAYGPSAASIATMRATSHTLADDPAIRAVAACLDDPLVATITDDGLTPDHRPATYTLGIGVRGRPGARGSEVLCRSARTPAEARRLASAFRWTLAHGKAPGRKPIPTINQPHAHSFEASATPKCSTTSRSRPRPTERPPCGSPPAPAPGRAPQFCTTSGHTACSRHSTDEPPRTGACRPNPPGQNIRSCRSARAE